MISERTGMALIVLVVVCLNLYLMGEPGGRNTDSWEQHQVDYEPDVNDTPATPMTMAELEAELNVLLKSMSTPSPSPK